MIIIFMEINVFISKKKSFPVVIYQKKIVAFSKLAPIRETPEIRQVIDTFLQ